MKLFEWFVILKQKHERGGGIDKIENYLGKMYIQFYLEMYIQKTSMLSTTKAWKRRNDKIDHYIN